MDRERKAIDRAAIDAAIEGVMEQVCGICHHCYAPAPEDQLTGICSACASCSIEGEIKNLTALVENQVSAVFGHAIADTLKEFLEGKV